jgi:NADH-quinone oxidoreductase subunit H
MQTNRAIFPIAKIIIYMNLFFGGADNWLSFCVKVFVIYLWSAFVGVVFPRFRVEQSIRWFLVWAVPLGVLSIVVV